jgi:hypothetical protein
VGHAQPFRDPPQLRLPIFNGSGKEPARLACTANLPAVLKMFHDERFVFGDAWAFAERAGKSKYFDGKGDFIPIRPGNHLWETNFVPDLAQLELKPWSERGAGGSNIMFALADGTMHAHISEMPVGPTRRRTATPRTST